MNLISGFIGLVPVGMMQGLTYALIAVAIMIPFRILNFSDMTGEGAFPFGACVCAKLLMIGFDPVMALLGGALAGFVAGVLTGYIHEKAKINTLLCGILVLSMLYSVNIRVMGQPNSALFAYSSVFSWLPDAGGGYLPRIVMLVVIDTVVGVGVLWFLGTQHGLAMRAIGSSPSMAKAQGINVKVYTLVGLGLANLFAALGGAMLAQNQGFADVNMGFGVLVNGLAALLLGEAVVGNRSMLRQVLAPILGSIIYFQLISVVLAIGFQPSDLKLVTALFVLVTLLSMAARKKRGSNSRKSKAVAASA
ncbi:MULTISPECIES: ABC transporter permease [Paraburkholderia]|uniref:ABC transport system permease protein n=1 Tax=Paraburkholderia silvatlantica TaxID=321895 RepID=A0A2U1ABI1_9BURK|nr:MULTISPECIES: ABC transporter permease [Paraburkholderia]MBB2930301.1 putative ABC transport system permease protein [Paraburkholderia silvatlantica]PVY32131.1 putative ABC transport system permease protein [Paraburkholderia silvatlantica]PXW37751.1 putative ABC transport system permease protein [Paraburkholderia silvatlantica]PYE25572.1 putative ABC transport system permease protein [Paraburkholderia silvatlantica]TDQ97785.1 putative ABC transport system permease protein [Paraburkholderia 